jgi:glutamine synthetase
MTLRDGAVGRSNFIETFGLWSDDDRHAAKDALAKIRDSGIELIRLSFADQHGLLRGKTLLVGEIESVFRNGCTFPTTLLGKDTSNKTIYPVFTADGGFGVEGMGGVGDLVMVPLPLSFRVLPWSPNTGWMLCDIYLKHGEPIPFSTRNIYRQALRKLAETGHDYVAGLEVEFYILKLDDQKILGENSTQPPPPPRTNLVSYGYQYLSEIRFDQFGPVIELLLDNLRGLDLPLRSFEGEFGPSQIEVTFNPTVGLAAADNLVLFRSAVKQICRRHGYHATFMCRPGIPNFFSSGWHLHQSLTDAATGKNAFAPSTDGEFLSEAGISFVAGLMKHARASCLFTTPTINGYKRFRPYSLAPDRIIWGRDHKGAMIRIVNSGVGDPGTRVENRVAEPAANPYLCMASQVLTGLAGMQQQLMPPTASDTPYEAEAEPLPRNLMEALSAFKESGFYQQALGTVFCDYIVKLKESEISRFLSEVTDWEQREYFELF